MARTDLTVQQVVRTGLVASYTAAIADGHQFLNNGKTVVLHVVNASGGNVVVSILTPGSVDGLAIPDRTVTVAAGTDRFIGPFPADVYNQSDGKVYVDTDTQTSITYAAIRV